MSDILVCPVTKQTLADVDREMALDVLGEQIKRFAASRASVAVREVTEKLLLRSDGKGAYPVVDGVPLLMAPEMLATLEGWRPLDTGKDPYREAYEEMDFYDAEAAKAHSSLSISDAKTVVGPVVRSQNLSDPEWLDATYDIASQSDAYQFLSPVQDRMVLQLGGKGVQAVKFLLAGASESWLLTPMLGEAIFAQKLAAALGVGDRFMSVVGIAEELPFKERCFDRIYSNGSMHHTLTERAFPEIRRVLRPNGRFAAFEPWRAPGYGIGTKVFGKRERGVNCRPMERDRVRPFMAAFADAAVIHHGTFTRYPLIALGKLGVRPRSHVINRITQFDDKLASKSSLRRYGSSVALLAGSTVE